VTKQKKDMASYLWDMLTEIIFIENALKQGTIYDDLISRAVLRSFTVLGEAAKRVDETTRKMAADVPWQKIVDTRNFLSHEYEEINLQKIQEIVDRHLPSLKQDLLVLYKTLTGTDYAH
jgi:uncharacterized protein with HEPN domain